MIDFDETPPFGHRFETVDSINQDPDKLTDINNPDTDGDNVNDKNEIKLYRRGGWDRNLDQDDFLPPWDDDSDNGGREDGEEDTDRDGEYEWWNPFDNELDPLDALDDFADNDPPNGPTNGQTVIVSSHEAVFTWDCSDPDGDLMRFKIIINRDEDPKDVTIYNEFFKSVFDSTMNFTFSNLDSETTYWWSIRAQDPLGAIGPRSDWWSFATPGGATKIEVDSGQLLGSISAETFHIYYFDIIADGDIYTITVNPTRGDPDLYASRYQEDVDEIEDLLHWDETCPPGSSHCASSTESGLSEDAVTFKTMCGERYYSYFSIYGDEESQYKVQVTRTNCTDADGDCYSPYGGECGPEDCRDNDTMIHPGAIEGPEGDPTCSDGFDNDCDRIVDGMDPGCGSVMRLLPDTGVEFCYNDFQEIPCPAQGEPFYGQDAQYVIYPMNYTDNGDETVSDNVTGLIWQQEDDGVGRSWYDAIDYCEDLTISDYDDWRLPDEYELQGIVDYGRYFPAIDSDYFYGQIYWDYWTSSTYVGLSGYAWTVDNDYGSLHSTYKGTENFTYVRCVRGDSLEKSFTDNGDKTVSDNLTGLMWQQDDDDEQRNWKDALAYCESLDLTGFSDWRLPNVKELRSIIDNTTYSPAIDETYFPGTASLYYQYYWSSSPYESWDYYAWDISPAFGYVGWDYKTNHKYVRCVR